MKQALALSALAVLGAATAAPAFAGPYVGGKAVIKGTDEDFDKSALEARVGYETKVGNLKPYIEVGPNWETEDGGETETSTALEIGSKIKLTDNLGAKVKAEYTFTDESEVDWKYEASVSYEF
jgi:opacity protein-like surface antigen